MELMETIYNRRSVRFYTGEPVEKDTIEKLIKAGIQAPSAMNVQPWAFAVIQDKALLQKISDETKVYLLASISERPYLECYRQIFSDPEFHIFYNAPALIITLAKPEGANASCDCTLAAQNIMLAAHSLGLGSCWIGVNVNEKVYHRGCGQKPGLSIIPGGIACFPMKRELKPLTYSYSTI